MRNRAKCKLCLEIIESYHSTDLVICKCGQISLDGGDSLRCHAFDWNNFLRVDDEGNEIIVTVKDKSTEQPIGEERTVAPKTQLKTSKKDVLELLQEIIKNYERLPTQAMYAPISHADLLSVLFVLSAWFKVDLE